MLKRSILLILILSISHAAATGPTDEESFFGFDPDCHNLLLAARKRVRERRTLKPKDSEALERKLRLKYLASIVENRKTLATATTSLLAHHIDLLSDIPDAHYAWIEAIQHWCSFPELLGKRRKPITPELLVPFFQLTKPTNSLDEYSKLFGVISLWLELAKYRAQISKSLVDEVSLKQTIPQALERKGVEALRSFNDGPNHEAHVVPYSVLAKGVYDKAHAKELEEIEKALVADKRIPRALVNEILWHRRFLNKYSIEPNRVWDEFLYLIDKLLPYFARAPEFEYQDLWPPHHQ